MALSEFYTM